MSIGRTQATPASRRTFSGHCPRASPPPLQFPAPKRLPLGPLMDFGYENEVLFPFSFDVADTVKPGPAVLHAKVDWLVCREVCIPGKAESGRERATAARGAGARPRSPAPIRLSGIVRERCFRSRFPPADTAVFQPTRNGFRLAVDTGQRETQAAFFPEDENILDNPAPQTVTPTATGLILELKKDPNLTASPAQLKGVLELSGGRNYEIAATAGNRRCSGRGTAVLTGRAGAHRGAWLFSAGCC